MVGSTGVQPGADVQSRSINSFPMPDKRSYLLGSLALIALVAALYLPVKDHPFVNYDDNIYVTDNLHVQSGLNWDTITWAFTTYDAGNWHPLTWLSHALDFQMYDANAGGHHLSSLLWHALNAVLLFWVLLRATGCAGRSFMVAALFAVHPINVESVAWIAERKTLLSMTFFVLALGSYRWYAAKPALGRYLVVAALFALGLMAKPQIITLPFVLLLWDYWPLQRMALPSAKNVSAEAATPYQKKTLLALVEEKLPLLAIAAASAAMTMKAQKAAGAVVPIGMYPLSVRLSNAIVSYARYLAKAFWPAHLALIYPHPENSLKAWQVYGALVLLLAVSLLVVEKRRRRYLPVGWLWFLGTLVPMIGLVQVGRQAMADRYAYLPLLGVFIMLCWAVGDWAAEKRISSTALTAVSCAVLFALVVAAHRQIGYWADNVTLWTHTIEVTGPNYLAQDSVGGALLGQNRREEANAHFQEALAIHPIDPVSNLNVGLYEQQHGDLTQAIEHYKVTVRMTTSPRTKAKALNNMGMAYRDLGDGEQARECFDAAKQLQAE